MSRHTMLQQYDLATRDHMIKHRNLQQRYERIFKADTPDHDDIDEERLDGDNGGNGDNGNGHDARMAQHRKRASNRKGFKMPTRQEVLKGYVRSAGGVIPLCKRIVAKGVSDISEHELTQLAVDAAKREYGISDDAKAFAKMFTDTGPTGDTLRRAIQIAKVAQVGGDDADPDDAAAALEELHRLADAERRRDPALSASQAFARVFADPGNAALAHRAHKRPTANAKNAFPFPR